jgi:hypothetical protein
MSEVFFAELSACLALLSPRKMLRAHSLRVHCIQFTCSGHIVGFCKSVTARSLRSQIHTCDIKDSQVLPSPLSTVKAWDGPRESADEPRAGLFIRLVYSSPQEWLIKPSFRSETRVSDTPELLYQNRPWLEKC